MTSISVNSQHVCVQNQDRVVGEQPIRNDPAFTGKVRKPNRIFRLFSKLFSRKKSAPSGPGDTVENLETELMELNEINTVGNLVTELMELGEINTVENLETELMELDEINTLDNHLQTLESELAENRQLVTDSSAENYTSIFENNRQAVDHAVYCKVTDDLRNDIEKLTSENSALKEPIEKYDKMTNTSCQTSNSTTQTVESDTSQDYDNPCDTCGFPNGSGDSKDMIGKKSVSVCSRCFVDRKTVDVDMNRLQNELNETKKLLAEKDKALSDLGRRIRENERYFKTDIAELESKQAMAYELYKQCELTNLNLEKERDAGLKREKKLENRIEYLSRELKRKDDLIGYERNNVLSMRKQKINLDLSKKSSETERDKSANKTTMKRIKPVKKELKE